MDECLDGAGDDLAGGAVTDHVAGDDGGESLQEYAGLTPLQEEFREALERAREQRREQGGQAETYLVGRSSSATAEHHFAARAGPELVDVGRGLDVVAKDPVA